MSRRSSLAIRLLLPAALVVLVATLATLQYHWLGQVSEAERDRLQTSLRQSAKDMADDFDRELLRFVHDTAERLDVDEGARLGALCDTLRGLARHGEVSAGRARDLLCRLRCGRCAAVDVPAGDADVRDRAVARLTGARAAAIR